MSSTSKQVQSSKAGRQLMHSISWPGRPNSVCMTISADTLTPSYTYMPESLCLHPPCKLQPTAQQVLPLNCSLAGMHARAYAFYQQHLHNPHRRMAASGVAQCTQHPLAARIVQCSMMFILSGDGADVHVSGCPTAYQACTQ